MIRAGEILGASSTYRRVFMGPYRCLHGPECRYTSLMAGKNSVKLPTELLVYWVQWFHIWHHQEPEMGKRVIKQTDMQVDPLHQAVGRVY